MASLIRHCVGPATVKGRPGRRQSLLLAAAACLPALFACSGDEDAGPSTSGAGASTGGAPSRQDGSAGGDTSLGETAGSTGTGGSTASGGAGGAAVRDGCSAPPDSAFDPVAAFVAPHLATTAVVTSADDDGPGSLRDAVARAPVAAVIGFDAALAGQTIRVSSTIELPHGLTIDGSGAPGLTIDGQQQTRIFHFNGDAPTRLAFYSLRLVNGRTDGSGGAISVNGGAIDLEIAGCTFEDNAGSEGGAVRAGYAKLTDIFIHDSIFANNNGSVPGGGNGFSGGAVSATGGNVHVARCRFEGNVGPTTGALYTIHSDPLVEDSVFIDNRSTGDSGSGAFFADGGGPGDHGTNYDDPANQIPGRITLVRTLFEGNRGAGDDGGAVEAYAYPLDVVTFDSVVLRNNRSDPGRAGAAFIHADHTVRIVGTAFVDNYATQPGGAIWADGSALYEIENSLFSGNVTEADLGGALRLNVSDEARLRITSSTFVDNVASDGNGALWMGGQRDARVKNTILAHNTSFSWSQQINFPVTNDGGNILWPDPMTSDPTLPEAEIVDPLLGDIEEASGTYVRAPRPGSPAIGAAVTPSVSTDQRGAARDSMPDIGAFEVGAVCGAANP